MTKDADMHGDSKDAAARLRKMRDGDNGIAGEDARAPGPVASGAAVADPWERPADRMLAAQAALVDECRGLLTPFRLVDVHAENVRPFNAVGEPVDRHEAALAAERLAARVASDVPAPAAEDAPERERVKYSAADDRPTSDFEPRSIEAARKRLPGEKEDA